MKLTIGGKKLEKLEITVKDYEREITGEYFYDNWLRCSVNLAFGGFSGCFDASFITRDFIDFLSQMEELYKTLKGEAKFVTLEKQLELLLVGDGKGLISFSGRAIDYAGAGNTLNFQSEIDQSYLQVVIHQLKKILKVYPERAL